MNVYEDKYLCEKVNRIIARQKEKDYPYILMPMHIDGK